MIVECIQIKKHSLFVIGTKGKMNACAYININKMI